MRYFFQAKYNDIFIYPEKKTYVVGTHFRHFFIFYLFIYLFIMNN